MKGNVFNHNLLSLSGLGSCLMLFSFVGVFVHWGWEFHLWRPVSWKCLGPTTYISTLTCCPMIITWDLSLTSRIHILAAGDILLTQVDRLNRTQENLTLPLSLLWGPLMIHSSPQQTLGIETSFQYPPWITKRKLQKRSPCSLGREPRVAIIKILRYELGTNNFPSISPSGIVSTMKFSKWLHGSSPRGAGWR